MAAVDPAAMSLDQLDAALDGFEGSRRELEAAELAVLAEYERRGGHRRSGSVSPATELAHRHGRERREVRARVSTAQKLRRLPHMAEALAARTVTVDHARILARALTERTAEAMARDEAMLVRLARRLGADDYRKAVRHWSRHADADGPEPADETPSEWHLSTGLDGVGHAQGRFGPVDTATIKGAVDLMLDELHRTGDDGGELAPIAQRRAEALVELVRRGAGLDPELAPTRRTRPQVVVTIDHDNLVAQLGMGELDTGSTVSAAAVRRLACDAEVISAVFDRAGELLDLGRRARLVTPAQRAALVLRDRGCVFPGCDRPAAWCDAHHIDHWVEGGPTDLANLVLLCSTHHHLLHEGGWQVRGDPQVGPLTFTGPDGRSHHPGPRWPSHPDPFRRPPGEPRPPARGAPTDRDDDQRPAA